MSEIKSQDELEAKIAEIFKKFDINKNNTIDEEELSKAMQAISPQVTKDIVQQTFLALDLDKNTRLSLEEFKNFVYKTLTTA